MRYTYIYFDMCTYIHLVHRTSPHNVCVICFVPERCIYVCTQRVFNVCWWTYIIRLSLVAPAAPCCYFLFSLFFNVFVFWPEVATKGGKTLRSHPQRVWMFVGQRGPFFPLSSSTIAWCCPRLMGPTWEKKRKQHLATFIWNTNYIHIYTYTYVYMYMYLRTHRHIYI